MAVVIDRERCINCSVCVDICIMDVLLESEPVPKVAYPRECWHCGACMLDCPRDAIRLALPPHLKPIAIKVR